MSTDVASTPAAGKSAPLRLEYLDGLRALAALYVVVHHAYLHSLIYPGRQMPEMIAARYMHWAFFGHQAVAIFIVLSGYCLMLPVVRSANRQLRDGFWGYIKRRAIRILPPYYAIILLTLFLVLVVDGLGWKVGVHWDISLPVFDTGTILSHLFLVHNLRMAWFFKIGHPLWSVATEWQIYFLFPALLLPLWRRFGNSVAVGVGLLLGCVPLFVEKWTHSPPDASFWFIGLFAMGMAGADIGFTKNERLAALRERLPWNRMAFGLFALFVVLIPFLPIYLSNWNIQVGLDSMVGLATLCLIVHCTRAAQRGEKSLALRVLDSRPVVWLGSFSYSLYLTHALTLAIFHIPLRQSSLDQIHILWIMLTAGTLLTIPAAYLFYLCFERPVIAYMRPKRPATSPEPQSEKAVSIGS